MGSGKQGGILSLSWYLDYNEVRVGAVVEGETPVR